MDNITNSNNNKSFKKTKDILKQFGIIILYFALNLLLVPIFQKGILSKNFYIANTTYLLVELIILTIFIFIFRKTLIPEFYEFKKNGKKLIKDNYKYYLYGLLIMFVSNLIISSFIDMPTNEELNRKILFELPIYSVISIAIIAPIVEEAMTRIILKDTFKHEFIYYLLSGLIFGSLHMLASESIKELFYIIPYGALGFVFAMIYKKTNNVWTNIFFHALHNTIALLLIFLVGA